MRLPDAQRSRAVLLGTSTYRDSGLPALPAVVNNVRDLGTVLASPQGAGLPAEHSRTCLDEPEIAVIGSALAAAVAEAEDLLLVYYAGHGLIGDDGELYLALNGTRGERALVAWTALPFPLIRRSLATARAANRVLILDCCFSGRAVEAMTNSVSVAAGQLEVAGTYTLASSPANRTSNAAPGAEHTAFTGSLLRLLQHGTEQAPELLTLQAIYEHVVRELSAAGLPRPEQRNTRSAAGLALAPNHSFPNAEQRCRHAAASGDVPAMAALASLLDRLGDERQAMLWRRKAAEAGHVAEMINLGQLYRSVGAFDQARTWFQHAADSGSAEARGFLDG